MVEPRFYRHRMGEGRFNSFTVGYKDSDLWIGVDPHHEIRELIPFARQKLVEVRQELEDYLLVHPEFALSFQPVELLPQAPEIARCMTRAGLQAGTGPMAAVAGAFSEYLGRTMLDHFGLDEIVVENGGDIFLKLKHNLVLSIYAGQSSLSGKIGIEIPAGESPLGVCTSAATVGPSVSFGQADAVMVACKNCALADAWATAIGNQVKSAADIEIQLEQAGKQAEILSVVIVCQEQVGIRGSFGLKLIQS